MTYLFRRRTCFVDWSAASPSLPLPGRCAIIMFLRHCTCSSPLSALLFSSSPLSAALQLTVVVSHLLPFGWVSRLQLRVMGSSAGSQPYLTSGMSECLSVCSTILGLTTIRQQMMSSELGLFPAPHPMKHGQVSSDVPRGRRTSGEHSFHRKSSTNHLRAYPPIRSFVRGFNS